MDETLNIILVITKKKKKEKICYALLLNVQLTSSTPFVIIRPIVVRMVNKFSTVKNAGALFQAGCEPLW